MSTKSPGLTRLQNIPVNYTSNLVWININEFLTASSLDSDRFSNPKPEGLWVYNIISNNWRLYAAYPSDKFKLKEHSICYDVNTNIVWLFGADSKLVAFNTRSKKFKMVKFKAKSVGREPGLIIIDKKLHVIGGGCNKHHLIWNDVTTQFETKYRFNQWTKGIFGHQIIYIPTKHVLYVFGGYDPGGTHPNIHNQHIWKYDSSKSNASDSEKRWSKGTNAKLVYNPCILLPADKHNNVLIFGDRGMMWLYDTSRDEMR